MSALWQWLAQDTEEHLTCSQCCGVGGRKGRTCDPCGGTGCLQPCPACASWQELRAGRLQAARGAATQAQTAAEQLAAQRAAAVAHVTDADLALSVAVDADTYAQVLLARAARATSDPDVPALPEWFVRDEDVPLVAVPEEKPPARKPRGGAPKRPRRVVDVAALERQLTQLEAEQAQLCSPLLPDRAATRLKPRTARRVNEQMDRRLQRAVKLDARIAAVRWRLASARATEGAVMPPR